MVRFLSLLVLVLFFSCADDKYNEVSMTKLMHSNGLVFAFPAHLRHREIQDGFIVFPQGGLYRRSPIQVAVRIVGNQKPNGIWSTRKYKDGNTVHYKKSSQTGGSGGTEYTLETWVSSAGGYIMGKQLVQTELGKPDFSLSWQVMSNITIISSSIH